VTQILARRTKNNPILLGEPGVGKTAIAEGLATAIVTRTTSDGTPLPGSSTGSSSLWAISNVASVIFFVAAQIRN
jgi:ATP-dependent Clp protease ATP-binding subunit ClpA